MMLAFPAAVGPNTEIAVCTNAQLAMATRGNVRKPAPCSSRARCHPIGKARTYATSKWTRWSRLSVHMPKMLAISSESDGELRHHARILMLQDMTVRHVGIDARRLVREPHQDLADTALRDRGDVLPAGALRRRRLAVLRHNAELTAMDVHGMEHHVASF